MRTPKASIRFACILILCAASITSCAAETETIALTPTQEISKGEIFVWRPDGGAKRQQRNGPPALRGVLVLCSGQNGSSKGMLEDRRWQEFAVRERLALVGMHFVSSDKDLKDRRGYFVASRGSGSLLLEGLKEAGLEKLPRLLYGFSGGAHFVMSFAAWMPGRVAAFCAYSFAWWEPPPEELDCPALIVCGQADGLRYGSSLAYFQTGRRAGKPWTWVSLRETAHTPNRDLDEFVRSYFSSVLDLPTGRSIWVDNTTEKMVPEKRDDVSLSVLPCQDLESKWRKIHYP